MQYSAMLHAVYDAVVPLLAGTPVRLPTAPGVAPRGLWAAPHLLPGATAVAELGDGPKPQRGGVLIVNVFNVPTAGTGAQYAVCDRLTALEYTDVVADGGTVSFYSAVVSDLGVDSNGYSQVQFSIRYSAKG